MIEQLGQMGAGLCLGIGALGSALGIGAAGISAAGCWAREGRDGKPLDFKYVLLTAMPLSQTIYAFIGMLSIAAVFVDNPAVAAANSLTLLGLGIGCGLAQFASAYGQGNIGAAACRTLNDSGGKGMGVLIIAMGIAETVGIFAMVFTILGVGSLPGLPA